MIGALSSPYIESASQLRRLMLNLLLALLPGTVAYAWLFGPGVLVNIAIATLFALIVEAAVLWLRDKPITPHLADCSALVTAWLFALCLPMHAPWWLTVSGIGFAMIAGKHLYGGLGFNPFNPAMVGYVVLLISFPREMTTWFLPASIGGATLGFADSIAYALGTTDPAQWDTLTSATPLDITRDRIGQGIAFAEASRSPLFGGVAGAGWEWLSFYWLAGGLYLLATRTIRWQIPLALLVAMAAMAALFNLIDPAGYPPPLFHLFSGAVMLGAFFIATDPVSAATSDRGRLIYAAMIGVITYVIRSWGGYPDGIAFAVLLANMCVPLIDYYTRPRVYGESR